MLLAERQLKLIEKLIIANESQIDDMYNYFFKQEKISSTSSEKSHKNYYFTGKDLAESKLSFSKYIFAILLKRCAP